VFERLATDGGKTALRALGQEGANSSTLSKSSMEVSSCRLGAQDVNAEQMLLLRSANSPSLTAWGHLGALLYLLFCIIDCWCHQGLQRVLERPAAISNVSKLRICCVEGRVGGKGVPACYISASHTSTNG
jgi:hypothetical protein